jgi:hypothetical protein
MMMMIIQIKLKFYAELGKTLNVITSVCSCHVLLLIFESPYHGCMFCSCVLLKDERRPAD